MGDKTMRLISSSLIIYLVLLLNTICSAEASKPELSKEPLTEEQVLVYRAFIENMLTNSTLELPIHLVNQTDPIVLSSFLSNQECAKGLLLEEATDSAHVSHKLPEGMILNLKIVLVDPVKQRGRPEKDNSANRVLDDEMYLTLSEILFDKDHQHAVVSYIFESDGIVGAVQTQIFKKSGDKWKFDKQCIVLLF
jgi:hypothetical protein